MEIRGYKQSDLSAITDLMGDLGYQTTMETMKHRMKQIQSAEMYNTFVAEVNGEVVGMVGVRKVYYYEDDGVATQISALVTKQESQRSGVGKALVNFVEQWALNSDSRVLFLTSGIKVERKSAHEFYKRMGFEITGYRFVKKLKDNL
jgi:N-acetylglutamate synthase-like GNAT family acetyltransferase